MKNPTAWLSYFSLIFLVGGIGLGCQQSIDSTKTAPISESTEDGSIIEATSFGGLPLARRKATDNQLKKYEPLIDSLRQLSKLTEEDYIQWGQHLVTIFRFNDAIAAYSIGLEAFPSSYKLLRHRAHRYLSVRQVAPALADLHHALELIGEDGAFDIEYYPDGKIKGTYHYWIYYHLGLAHYFKYNYEKAVTAFTTCLALASTPKNKVGAIDWLYSSLLQNGQAEAAAKVLTDYQFDLDLDPNYPYTKRVQLYKGEVIPTELMDLNKGGAEWTSSELTIAYGIGNWYINNGEQAKGLSIHRKMMDSPYWNAWAYVAVDSELAENN